MRKKPTTLYGEVLQILTELKEEHPSSPISNHLYTALCDYGNFWGLSDKEVLFALRKYQAEQEMNIVSDSDVEKILRDTEKLFKPEPLDEEEEYFPEEDN